MYSVCHERPGHSCKDVGGFLGTGYRRDEPGTTGKIPTGLVKAMTGKWNLLLQNPVVLTILGRMWSFGNVYM